MTIPVLRNEEFLKYITEHLEYKDGIVYWKKIPKFLRRRKVGDIAGTFHKPSGYNIIMVKYKRVKRTHVIWYLVHGSWPTKQIDHIDGNRINDNIGNLRLVTPRENSINMHCHRNGHLPGTSRKSHTRTKQWRASITINNRCKYLGDFLTEQEAHEAYMKAVSELDSAVSL